MNFSYFIKKKTAFRQPFFAANCKTYAENNVPSSKNIHSVISQTFFIASSSIEYTVYEVDGSDTGEEADLLNFNDLDSDEFV